LERLRKKQKVLYPKGIEHFLVEVGKKGNCQANEKCTQLKRRNGGRVMGKLGRQWGPPSPNLKKWVGKGKPKGNLTGLVVKQGV